MDYYSDSILRLREKLSVEKVDQAERFFKILKVRMNPRLPSTTKELIEFLLKEQPEEKSFMGTIGRGTLHENLFGWLFPKYEPQISFGTGKGGVKNFGCSKVVVDFLHREKNIAYEVDGNNHKTAKQIEKDAFKERLLETKYGIEVYRKTNKEVESMLMHRLLYLADSLYDFRNFAKMRALEIEQIPS